VAMDEFVWIDGTWIREWDRPKVILFARSVRDKFVTKQFGISGFKPYFYVPDDEGDLIDALGRKVRRVEVKLPSDVPSVRNTYDWTDEADIVFDERFVIDAGIKYGFHVTDGKIIPIEIDPIQPRILYFDIEVRSPPEIMPNPWKADWPIVTIQTLDSYTDEVKMFTFGFPQIDDNQISCDSERQLLWHFQKYVGEVDPDVLTGWFSSGFDLPYLVRRSARLKIDLHGLSRFGRPTFTQRNEVKIIGRQCCDMLTYFRKLHKPEGELDRLDLKSVAKRFSDFEYEDIGDMIDAYMRKGKHDELISYIHDDVVALKRIDDAVGLFTFYEYLRWKIGCKLESTIRNAKMIEILLMRSGIKPLPTRKYNVRRESYTGALVLTPPIGIHEWVGVYDATTLYPYIITAYNVSPDVDGVFAKTVKTVLEEREKLRRLRLVGKADESTRWKEVVLKFLCCSWYGYCGFSGARLYKKELAEFITSKGREIINVMKDWFDSKGLPTVYGDTDSAHVKGIRDPHVGLELENDLNEFLAEKFTDAEFPPTVKFEKLYRRILYKRLIGGERAAKKRYAGWIVWKDGRVTDKIQIVGLEYKRSDSAEITRELMSEFMRLALKEQNVGDIVKLIQSTIKKFGDLPIQKIAIPKGVTRDLEDYKVDSAWIVGIRNAQRLLGLRFRQDRKPRLLYCIRPVDRLCITEDIETLPINIEIDYQKMIEKTIVEKFRPLFEAVGLNWDQVIGGQTTLEDWI